jgi:hypothetical protein
MRVIERHIDYSSRRDAFKVIIFSCWHVGSRHCREDAIRKLVKEIASEPNTYFIGLGDLCDYIGLADIKRRDFSEMATWLFDNNGEGLMDIARAENKILGSYLQGLGPKCLGLTSGNHEDMIRHFCEVNAYAAQIEMLADGDNAHALDHRGILRLRFTRLGGSTWFYNIACSHGSGSGESEGALNNRLKAMIDQYEDVDLHAVGHWHRPAQVWNKRFMPGTIQDEKVTINAIAVPSLTSDMRYAENRDKRPLPIGWWELNITPDKERVDLQFKEIV